MRDPNFSFDSLAPDEPEHLHERLRDYQRARALQDERLKVEADLRVSPGERTATEESVIAYS